MRTVTVISLKLVAKETAKWANNSRCIYPQRAGKQNNEPHTHTPAFAARIQVISDFTRDNIYLCEILLCGIFLYLRPSFVRIAFPSFYSPFSVAPISQFSVYFRIEKFLCRRQWNIFHSIIIIIIAIIVHYLASFEERNAMNLMIKRELCIKLFGNDLILLIADDGPRERLLIW